MTNKVKKTKKSLSYRGWLPNYHGAWAMISVPILIGIIHAGFHPIHWILLLLWWISYFCFFACTMWLRSKRQSFLLPPVQVYATALVVLTIWLAFYVPYLAWWLLLFIPLFLVTVWETMQRRERSFLNDTVTIVAACLMLPVAYDLGTTGACFQGVGSAGILGTGYLANARCGVFSHADWQLIWVLTCLVCGYFIGTVFYVKTNIRERRSKPYLIASFVFHLIFTIGAFKAADYQFVPLSHAYVWVFLTCRSLAVPWYGRHRHWLSAKKIGMGEAVFSLLVFFTLV